MSVQRSDNPINRVKCVVNTCNYYTSGDHCLAEKIEVQHRNANSSEETDCATFAPKG